MADHGRRWWKWSPSAPHEALHSNPMHQMDGQQPPEQADIIFGAVEGVYGPQNTPMLWQWIIAGTKEQFEGRMHPHPPKYIHKLRGLSPIHSMRRRRAQGLMWGTRGPLPPASAMVVAVVMPVVFCAKATEILKNAKNNKISCFIV
jgi:hypothetical protein